MMMSREKTEFLELELENRVGSYGIRGGARLGGQILNRVDKFKH